MVLIQPRVVARTGLKNIFCSGWQYAGCDFVKLREKILECVSEDTPCGFFARFPRLASHLANLATKLFLKPVSDPGFLG
jgi:hypothetical protein